MKQLIKNSLAILVGCAFATAAIADETNNFETAIVQAQAKTNIKPIIFALSDAESLWVDQPDKYFAMMRDASQVLAPLSLTNSEARQGLLVIFTNTLSKPFSIDTFPTNDRLASTCIKLQSDIAITCSYVVKESRQKPLLLLFAKFIGSMRSHVISNYKPKSKMLNGFGVTSQEYERNQRNMAEDNLQVILRRTKELTSFLISDCAYFPSSDPSNADFIKQISDAAHLTDEERNKL
jgi:hypothetical protein